MRNLTHPYHPDPRAAIRREIVVSGLLRLALILAGLAWLLLGR